MLLFAVFTVVEAPNMKSVANLLTNSATMISDGEKFSKAKAWMSFPAN